MSKKFLKSIVYIAIVLVVAFLFVNGRATDATKVSSLSDGEYPVYNGRGVYEYYRTTLNDKQKIVYDEIKESYLQFKPEFSTQVQNIRRDEFSQAFKAVVLDHPEIFWIKSYSMNVKFGRVNTNKVIHLKYAFNEEEAKALKSSLEPKYNNIITEAKKLDSKKKQVKYVHDILINMGTYTANYSKDDEPRYQSFISLFEDGKTVCAGYSYGFKFIMDNLGIDSISIQDVNKENEDDSHVWNMVKLDDGKWYNLDITWDGTNDELSYDYFLKGNISFYIDHKDPGNLPNEIKR